MENIIVVLILILILAIALPQTIKHLKGEGDCCGGAQEKPKKKTIQGKPIKKVKLKIQGMHCNNCRVRLENKLNEIDGIVAKVSLGDGSAKLSLYSDVDMEEVLEVIKSQDFKGTVIE